MNQYARPAMLLTAMLLATILLPAPALAGEGGGAPDDLAVGVDVGVFSKYVWRGIDTVDDFVLQPAVDLSMSGFGLNLWGNLDLTDENDSAGEFTEVDLTGSYSFSLDSATIGLGVIAYFFPGADGDTTELFASVGFDTALSPTLTVYRDVDEVDGFYLALSGSHAFADLIRAGEATALSPEVSISIGFGDRDYNQAYFSVDGGGFADLTLGLALPVALSDTATLAVSVHYSRLLDGDLRDATDDPDNLWFGLSLSIGF